MRISTRLLTLTACALLGGCVTMGRATDGHTPDPDEIHLVPGETDMAQVLADLGPASEWHQTPFGIMIIYRHRRYHFGSYGFDLGILSFAGPPGYLTSIIWDNLHFTYDRIQEADERLAILFDGERKVLSYAYRDDRGRLTVY